MVSEMGGGQPPSPADPPYGVPLLNETHPVGVVTLPPAAKPSPPVAPQQQSSAGESSDAAATVPVSQADALCEAMQVDGTGPPTVPAASPPLLAPPSRSPSPFVAALKPSAAAAAAGGGDGQQLGVEQQPTSFVPVGELGGGTASVVHADPPSAGGGSPAAVTGSDGDEPSSLQPSAMERPVSAAGYESGDDMDLLSMQHCTNCTGPLWGHICMDCGHMTAHDDDIFNPTVAPAAALHRPRLQGDALTVICWDERMELHEESGSSMHPERPDRVRAVMARLRAAELAGRCQRLPAREATLKEVGACHIPELVEAVDLLSEQSRLQGNAGLHFSPDTYVNQHTAMCAKLSAGACVDVTTAVVRGKARAGIAVVRPPGHHAESNTAMGFCFFNNAGIAARAAQAAGAERVLILDWDVHHGNGTQHIFEGDSSVLYMSLHRYDGGSFYPGTGAAHEVGEGAGEGYSVNVPWPCGGMRNADYLAAFNHVVLPIAYEYAPDLVIISAGFDAAEGDPIGGCHLTSECYAHMAAQLQLVAPTVALLEGGYNLLSTAKGTEAVLRVLLGERPPVLPAAYRPACADAMSAVAQVMRIQSRYWSCMRGLVQQQFKVLAAAAARQEQLAAMKARRVDALAAGEGGQEDSPPSPLCEAEVDKEGDEEAAMLGSMHPHPLRAPAALDALDEETGTPHQQYCGGSGWESDADLASGEQQLSEDASDEDEQQLAGWPHDQGACQPLAASGWGMPDDSPNQGTQQQVQEQHAASDTLPISDSDGPGSGSASEGHHGTAAGSTEDQHADSAGERPAGLTSASLSPAVAAEGEAGISTPAGEQLLAASDTPASGLLATAGGSVPPPAGQMPVAAPRSSSSQQAAWPKGLSVKLKRPGHVASHQRLSPALGEEAMQLVQPGPADALPQPP